MLMYVCMYNEYRILYKKEMKEYLFITFVAIALGLSVSLSLYLCSVAAGWRGNIWKARSSVQGNRNQFILLQPLATRGATT